MAGPVLRTYKAGSIIYFIEDRGTEVYVLQKGRVILISNSLDNAVEVKEDVQKGEFFGVKSALGMYPREETAQVLADSLVLVFTPQLFEQFCMKNSRLVLQMLKVFSGQLRKVHRKVRELLGETGQQENSVELLRTAESFYKINELDHAKYAFNSFLKFYSQTSFAPRAQTMLNLISKGQPYPVEMDGIDAILEKANNHEIHTSNDHFGMPHDSGTAELEAPPLEDFSSHDVPDMMEPADDMGDLDLGGMDIPDMDIPDMSLPNTGFTPPKSTPAPQPTTSVKTGITQFYYDGLNEFSKQNWDGAIQKFEMALQQTKFENDAEAGFLEKSMFELGRALLKKRDYAASIAKFSEFVKKYPRSPNIKKAMMYVAENYEKKGDKQRAAGLYNKVFSMPPKDKDSNFAKQQFDRLMK